MLFTELTMSVETGMNGNRMQEQAQNPHILEFCL